MHSDIIRMKMLAMLLSVVKPKFLIFIWDNYLKEYEGQAYINCSEIYARNSTTVN